MEGAATRVDDKHQEMPDGPVSGSQQSNNRLARFLRDVSVNVLANLVAAALVYLASASAGLLPTSPQLVAASISTILGVAFLAMFVVSRFLREQRRHHISLVAFLVFGAAVISGAMGGAFDHEPFPKWFFIAFGVWTIAAGAMMLCYTRRFRP